MKYELKRIDLWSAIKISFVVHAIIGLLVGLLIGLAFSLFFAFVGQLASSNDIDASLTAFGPLGGFLVGIFYAVFIAVVNGVIITGLVAILYNIVAGWVGGLKFEAEPTAMEPTKPTMTLAADLPQEKRAGDV